MKKALRETQTLRAGCSKVEPNISALSQTPFPGARDGQNLITWRWSLLSPTNPVWWRSMQAISSYRGNRPTNTHRHTHWQDRLQYTAPHLASMQCNNADIYKVCNINIIDFSALTLFVGWQEGHPVCKKKTECWFVDDLTGALHVFQFCLSPLPNPEYFDILVLVYPGCHGPWPLIGGVCC